MADSKPKRSKIPATKKFNQPLRPGQQVTGRVSMLQRRLIGDLIVHWGSWKIFQTTLFGQYRHGRWLPSYRKTGRNTFLSIAESLREKPPHRDSEPIVQVHDTPARQSNLIGRVGLRPLCRNNAHLKRSWIKARKGSRMTSEPVLAG
jgi:hypothetical protein